MTHEPETDIEPLVAEWFRDRYGEGAVETQAYQPGPYWFVDVKVDVGFATLFIEVENDAASIRPGAAQAAGYAGADPVKGVPIVVTPAGHADDTRVERLRSQMNTLILEFDDENGTFV